MITDNDNRIKKELTNRPIDESILIDQGWSCVQLATFEYDRYYINEKYEGIIIYNCKSKDESTGYEYCYYSTLASPTNVNEITLFMYTVDQYTQFIKLIEYIKEVQQKIEAIESELIIDAVVMCKKHDIKNNVRERNLDNSYSKLYSYTAPIKV